VCLPKLVSAVSSPSRPITTTAEKNASAAFMEQPSLVECIERRFAVAGRASAGARSRDQWISRYGCRPGPHDGCNVSSSAESRRARFVTTRATSGNTKP